MASTGFTFAGTGANVNDATGPWTTPENVTANDDSRAQTAEGSTTTSDRLRATNYGFAVPAGSTIDGVEARVRRIRTGGGAVVITTSRYRLVNAGSAIGTEKEQAADWATTEEAYTTGSSSDVWSATLTAAVVNSSTFGLDVNVTWDANLPTPEAFAEVDSVEINVHYTAPTGPKAGSLSLLGVGR